MQMKEFKEYLKGIYSKEHNTKIHLIDDGLFNSWVFKRLYVKEIESTSKIDEDSIYTMLNEIAIWYHKFHRTAFPDDILNAKDKIVTCLHFLNTKRDVLSSQLREKELFNQNLIDELIISSKTLKPTEAKLTAKIKYKEKILSEARKKTSLEEIESIMKSFKEIVYAMSQRVAWLRDDKKHTTQL